MGMKKVLANGLRSGDETQFFSKPGSSNVNRVRVVKALSLPDGTIEVKWEDVESGKTLYEGLYSYHEELEIFAD